MRFYRNLGAIAALAFVLSACNIEDSGNSYAAGDTVEGSTEESPDPSTIGDDKLAISGTVTDIETMLPIQGALISTEPPIGQILTNGQGQYVFTATEFPDLQPEKLFRITATKLGYVQNSAQLLVKPGHNRNADIQLQKAATEFRIDVSQELVEFSENDFFGDEDTATKQISMQLSGTTAASVGYSINVPPPGNRWISASPTTGTLEQTPRFLDITVSRKDLEAKTYNGEVNVVAEGGLATIQVKLVLTSASVDDDDDDVPVDDDDDVPDDDVPVPGPDATP